MANPNQCYLPASRCFGTGPDTIYILQKVATRMQATPFYFDYQNTCYSVNPTTTAVQPGAGVSYVTGSPSGPYSTCTNCSSGCYLAPPDISFCPGTAGNQTINATMATPNGAWSASVTCSVSADVTVSPSSGTSDASGNFSFTVNYSGADSNTQTCTINVAMAGCSNGAVDVDISAFPGACPAGLSATYNVAGGPVTSSSCYNSPSPGQGNYIQVKMGACGQCGYVTSPSFGGTVSSGAPNYPGCQWADQSYSACWGGYALAPAWGPGPSGVAVGWGDDGQGTGSQWYLKVGGTLGDMACTGVYCTLIAATYVKSCGSTPKGVYQALPGLGGILPEPKTLYVC